MGTLSFTICNFSWGCHHNLVIPHYYHHSLKESRISTPNPKAAANSRETYVLNGEDEKSGFFHRRSILISGISLASTGDFGFPGEGLAVVKQGLLAGRVPGLSEPDEKEENHNLAGFKKQSPFLSTVAQFPSQHVLVDGGKEDIHFCRITAETLKIFILWVKFAWLLYQKIARQDKTTVLTGWRTYRRPEEKSGGHGVGWSPIIPYVFSVPGDWEEVPVSIADLGGTEIDLRFASSKEGRLFVIVAPVLRFADDLGSNATIQQVGPPDKVINAFGPEVIGENVEGKVLSINVIEHSGRTYYQYELEPPHVLITATAAGNRLYLFGVTGNGLQWKRHYNDLKRIADSFRVV